MKNKRVAVMLVCLVFLLFINVFIFLTSSSNEVSDGLPEGREEEPILSFETELRIGADDFIYATEQVKVKSLAKNLKRGITRRFLNAFTDSKNNVQNPIYELVSVMRNGETIAIAEPQTGAAYTTFYLGEADKFLTPGIYHYIFQYTIENRIENLEKSKRLVFDVTGTPLFPIHQASATLRFADKLRQQNFTFQGFVVKPDPSQEAELRSSENVQTAFSLDDGQIDPAARDKPVIKIWTTKRLEPLERLEIEVNWATE